MKVLVRNDRKDSTAHSYQGPIFDSNRNVTLIYLSILFTKDYLLIIDFYYHLIDIIQCHAN